MLITPVDIVEKPEFPCKIKENPVDIKWTKISVSEDVLCMDIYTSIFVHTL